LGLHLPRPRRLTSAGVKPIQVVNPLYESYWLYAAVEPATGEACWWEFPSLDADGFTLFLKECSRQYEDSLNVMVLDQAPAHTAHRVVVPDNVVLLWLPPYSPELNPVERVWQDLKAKIDVLDPEVRSSVRGLRDHVADIVTGYQDAELSSLTSYAYLTQAIDAL
jgi:putative transposase